VRERTALELREHQATWMGCAVILLVLCNDGVG
jgi:hypothetical protein